MAGVSTIGPTVPIPVQGDISMTPGQTPEQFTAADDSDMSTAPATAPVRRRPRGDAPYAVVGRPRNEGHGKRLTAAFEALEVFPALAESRNRLLALIAEERPSTGDVVRAIESDVALVISVMRLANGMDSPKRGQVESVVTSVEVLSPEAVQRLAANAETFEFFERGKTWDAAPERFRLHAVAAFVRLADMLAHYSQGSPVSSTELLRAARTVGFGPSELRSVLYDLPYPSNDRPRAVEPCPLSTRELDVLKRLAQGMVYKQIALELSLSTSTVRTHLHNIYGKLGAVDRAQAVLHATERGWL